MRKSIIIANSFVIASSIVCIEQDPDPNNKNGSRVHLENCYTLSDPRAPAEIEALRRQELEQEKAEEMTDRKIVAANMLQGFAAVCEQVFPRSAPVTDETGEPAEPE